MLRLVTLCFSFVVVLLQQPTTTSADSVSVSLPSGSTVSGLREPVPGYGDTVQVFKGIPYANPPIGDRRLKPPQEPMPQTINATRYRPSCQQAQTGEFARWPEEIKKAGLSEDCLYLNVWVPKDAPGEVMVWIHGGAYVTGSGAMYDSRWLATIGRVIVVTVNYRLGVFGFLPTGGPEGTLGLQDQVMALQWVKKNIASFGGDPNRVTLFGESAGGTSVSILTRSPKTKGLFQKAISQSGTVDCAWALTKPENREQELQKIEDVFRNDFQCYNSAVDCVKSATPEQLVALTTKVAFIPPTVDNEFVTWSWSDASSTHPGLEIMIGTTPEESAYAVYMACSAWYTKPCDQDKGLSILELLGMGLAPLVGMDSLENVIHAYNQWYPMYIDNDDNANVIAATYLATDTMFHVPANRTAAELTKAGFDVFVYMMDLIPSMEVVPRAPWGSKAQHADDLPFVFAWRMTGQETEQERQQQESVIKLWTDFARGQPIPQWYPFGPAGEYLYITPDRPEGYTTMPYLPHQRDLYWHQYYNFGIFSPLGITTAGAARGVAGLTVLIVAVVTTLFFRY